MSSSQAADCPTGECDPPLSNGHAQEPALQEVLPSDPLNPATFVVPKVDGLAPHVVIEFCDRCRWLHRATWVQTELFLTFPPPAIRGITLIPLNLPETGGRFRVWLSTEHGTKLVWDRKTAGGFPELKDLKQRIRDVIQPGKSLGHSDKITVDAK